MLAGEILRKTEGDIVLLAMAAHVAYGNGLYSFFFFIDRASTEIFTALDSRVSTEHPRSVDIVNGVRLMNIYFGAREDVPIRDVQGSPHQFRSEFRRRAGLAELGPEERKTGRPRGLDAARMAEARKLLAQPNRTIEGVAAELGIAASTLYRYVPGGRFAVLSAIEAESAGRDRAGDDGAEYSNGAEPGDRLKHGATAK